ncbi:gelsolin-like protein 2 [Mizuhopecten yessoensis]|uniref:gelsolin-like protein 2 n=1 Tax=Mizuhopecten yessoensis TaxID=6573 RepID=UPI000B4593A2|nr:gelsolin-like protein 2 [Mizuhopecten yessoensis]
MYYQYQIGQAVTAMADKPALRKQKKYDWKDSNLALFGTKLEHAVKKESSLYEPAWYNAGTKVGRKIWRIVNFEVTDWPEEDYGKFYEGDSYIILDTYKKSGSDAIYHHIHFWIGKYSTQIPRDKNKLDSTDVYILDLGLVIYQWNGKGSNKDERFQAMQYIVDLKEQRCGKAISEVLDEESTEPKHKFFTYLDEVAEKDDDQSYQAKDTIKELYRLSDESGMMSFSLEKTGSIKLKDFDEKDVFIFDTKTEVFVFIGKDTSANESQFAMTYAHTYLMQTDHPLIPISCIIEQAIDAAFNFTSALAA